MSENKQRSNYLQFSKPSSLSEDEIDIGSLARVMMEKKNNGLRLLGCFPSIAMLRLPFMLLLIKCYKNKE